MFQTKFVEKLKTRNLCSIIFFPENRAVYETMWKNFVERGRPQMTTWRMRIACWITESTDTHKNTHTHTGCVILIIFPLLQWLHGLASVLRYTYIAYLVCNTPK